MIKKFLQKIFKKLSYFLFSKIYGKIEKSIKSDSDKRIKVTFANMEKDFRYKVYKITDGKLYTDRIHDTAVILENKIIEGPSFQLRNNNNSPISNNVVFEKGTPRILKKLDGTVASLLTGGGGNSNYWHWIYDVLPRLKLCEQIKKLEEIDYFILPSLEKKFQSETLDKLNISRKKMLSSVKFRHLKASELIVTDHPYVFTNNSHKDVQNIPEWIVKWLKEKEPNAIIWTLTNGSRTTSYLHELNELSHINFSIHPEFINDRYINKLERFCEKVNLPCKIKIMYLPKYEELITQVYTRFNKKFKKILRVNR